jgi:hypothetical protein
MGSPLQSSNAFVAGRDPDSAAWVYKCVRVSVYVRVCICVHAVVRENVMSNRTPQGLVADSPIRSARWVIAYHVKWGLTSVRMPQVDKLCCTSKQALNCLDVFSLNSLTGYRLVKSNRNKFLQNTMKTCSIASPYAPELFLLDLLKCLGVAMPFLSW